MREDGRRTCFTLGKTPGAETILLWDNLEGLFKWTTVSGFGAPRRSKSASAAYDGSWGLELGVRRTIPDGFMFVGAGRSFPMARDGILRVEAMMMVPSVNGQDGFGIALEWYDGENRYEAWVFYEAINRAVWWGAKFCGSYPSGLPLLPRATGAWHRLWMEIDLVRKEHVNVGIDADTVQLDGNKICTVADAGPVVAYVIPFVVVYYTGTRSGYFDDVLCYLV